VDADRPRDRPWGFLVTIGVIAVVGILLLVVPGLLAPGPAEPTPRPSPTPDPHVVVTEDGTIVFGIEDAAFVIRETSGTTVRELVRTPVSTVEGPGGSPTMTGAAGFAMACGTPGSSDYRRYVFGPADIPPSASSAAGMGFIAPDGVGSIAPDGLFLYALDASVPDEEASVSVTYKGQVSIGMGSKAFADMATIGSRQPSGCSVAG
jgi:hypothetical protein